MRASAVFTIIGLCVLCVALPAQAALKVVVVDPNIKLRPGDAITGEDSVELELRFRCPDGASAAARHEAVAGALRAALEPTGFALEVETRADGEWVRADLRLGEITPRVEEFLGRASGGR